MQIQIFSSKNIFLQKSPKFSIPEKNYKFQKNFQIFVIFRLKWHKKEMISNRAR